MKKLLVLTFVTFLFALTTFAQQERKISDTSNRKEMRQGQGRKEKMEKMKELGLTKEQLAKMKDVKKETKAKLQALKKEQTITVAEMNARKKAIMEESMSKMKVILTPEQFEKMKASMQHKGKGKRGKKSDEMEVDLAS